MGGIGMINDRVSNPFATKFVTPGRLAFAGLGEKALDGLAETLMRQHGIYQIIGPHGVGKTTLTYDLEERVERLCGSDTAFNFFRKTIGRSGGVRFANSSHHATWKGDIGENEFAGGDSSSAETLLVLDGVERLSWFQRLALHKSCQRKRIGLLLTTHRRVWGVRTLVELEPDFSRFESVCEELTFGHEFQLASQRLREIFSNAQGNMREALMTCYDDFEASRAKTAC